MQNLEFIAQGTNKNSQVENTQIYNSKTAIDMLLGILQRIKSCDQQEKINEKLLKN